MPGPKGVRRPEPSANRMAIRDRESYPAIQVCGLYGIVGAVQIV